MIILDYYIDTVIETLMIILMIMSFLIVFFELKKYSLNKTENINDIEKSSLIEKVIDKLFIFKIISLTIFLMIISFISEINNKVDFTPKNVEKYNICKENPECKNLLIDFYKDGVIKEYEMSQIKKLNKKFKENSFNNLYGNEKQYFENLTK